jgi:Baseplate J-like protein
MTTPTTSVPAIEFTPTGIVLPAESAILAGVQEDINGAFGGNLNPALNTPQGQLASSTTAIIADANSAIAELVDQVDPDNATGFMQNAVARIYFLTRNPGTYTTVQCQLLGELGVTVPVGAQAEDTSGNIYTCQESGTFGPSGTMTLPFANTSIGPIACPANTLTKIYVAIPGWDAINNSGAGVEGSNVETASEFEFRRQNSVAVNANGSIQAIYGNVFQVPGVIDCFVSENVTSNPISGPVNGNPNSTNYTLVPYSIYVAVTGGLAASVAQAIWQKKNEGSGMNGNTTVTVLDTSGYSFPQPAYPITFNIPNPTAFKLIVNIKNTSSLPSTIVADVQAACVAQFNGVVGATTGAGITIQTSGQRVRIGSLMLAAAFYGPVATCEGPSVPVGVLSIFIGSVFVGLGTLVNDSEVLTITTVTSGFLSPGTVVAGTDIPTETTIVQQLTGTAGGVGTYQMSAVATGTVSSPEAVVGAGGTSQQIGIDQQPTLSATDVVVNLV